ncbi:MAG: hypothetical protein DME50_12210 [Verrucomicrobia bacterium]|nr:MAG: hypothetical protein DME85_02175 [Verrucomicrobiota bacterium]PYK64692.1 MAG: hypothetical protein DME50_12210 [Verrucomicrobiota bacterium]
MRHLLAILSIFALLGALSSDADDVLPPRFNFDRYSAMLEKSPFAVATAVALPATTPDFAKDLYVANAAHSPEGDLVTIASSSDHNFKKYLTTKEPVDGYSIASIEWSDRVGETKVTISKDGQFASITFNQALMSQSSPAAPNPLPNEPNMMPNEPDITAAPPTGAAPALPVPTPFVPPVSNQQTPPPHTRGVIQRNPRLPLRKPKPVLRTPGAQQ